MVAVLAMVALVLAGWVEQVTLHLYLLLKVMQEEMV